MMAVNKAKSTYGLSHPKSAIPPPRHCSQRPVCCSSTGCGTPAASSCSASWTPLTALASEGSLTRIPAATCSNLHTSTYYSTLWRCPRRKSSCCCHWNRWVCWCFSSADSSTSFKRRFVVFVWMLRCGGVKALVRPCLLTSVLHHSTVHYFTVDSNSWLTGKFLCAVFVFLLACCSRVGVPPPQRKRM